MLLAFYRQYPSKLRADFQQYYQLNLDDMSVKYTVLHAADLAANLPARSRCMCALEPALEWSRQDHLLAETVNMLRILVWAQSRDGQKGRNRPKMIEPPRSHSRVDTHKEGQLSADEYRDKLNRVRKEMA